MPRIVNLQVQGKKVLPLLGGIFSPPSCTNG